MHQIRFIKVSRSIVGLRNQQTDEAEMDLVVLSSSATTKDTEMVQKSPRLIRHL